MAVVERHLVGGTCVNTGCTPTKALVASAYAARVGRRAAEYGVVIGGVSAISHANCHPLIRLALSQTLTASSLPARAALLS